MGLCLATLPVGLNILISVISSAICAHTHTHTHMRPVSMYVPAGHIAAPHTVAGAPSELSGLQFRRLQRATCREQRVLHRRCNSAVCGGQQGGGALCCGRVQRQVRVGGGPAPPAQAGAAGRQWRCDRQPLVRGRQHC